MFVHLSPPLMALIFFDVLQSDDHGREVFRQMNSLQFDGLKQALLRERELIVSSNLGFRMLGKEMVLSSDCIVEICKISKYVRSEDDLYGLRKSLTSRVYGVIVSYFS